MSIIHPTLNLVARPGAMPPQATFTRATTATGVNAIGQIATAASGALRHDFDPVTGEYQGWLIEEQRTNLCPRSADFATTWIAWGGAVTANSIAAPDGATTADTFTGDGTGGGAVYQDIAVSNATVHTASVFAKAGTTATLVISEGAVTGNYATFTLSGDGTAAITGMTSATIKAYGNGWYRCTATMTTAGTTYRLRFDPDDYGAASTNSVYLWGAQLEAGAFATSYVPTEGAATTRNADVLTVATSGFAFNPAEGTLYVDYAPLAAVLDSGSARGILALDDGTADNRIELTTNSGGATVAYRSVASASTDAQFDLSGLGMTAGAFTKMAAAFKAAWQAACADAGAVTTDIAAPVPTVTTLRLGSAPLTVASGHYKHVAYFPRRLSGADLQTITE